MKSSQHHAKQWQQRRSSQQKQDFRKSRWSWAGDRTSTNWTSPSLSTSSHLVKGNPGHDHQVHRDNSPPQHNLDNLGTLPLPSSSSIPFSADYGNFTLEHHEANDNPTQIPPNCIADLKLMNYFLQKAHKGVNMNQIAFHGPTYVYYSDLCPTGLGGMVFLAKQKVFMTVIKDNHVSSYKWNNQGWWNQIRKDQYPESFFLFKKLEILGIKDWKKSTTCISTVY